MLRIGGSGVLLVLSYLLPIVLACTDFVLVGDTFVGTKDNSEERMDILLKAAKAIRNSPFNHRLTFVPFGYKRKSLEPIIESLDDASEHQLQDVLLNSFANETITRSVTVGLSEAADVVIRRVLPRRRMSTPVIVIIILDGESATQEKGLEAVAARVNKKHYVHTFVVDPDDENISTDRYSVFSLLANGDEDAIITGQSTSQTVWEQLRSVISGFLNCEKNAKEKSKALERLQGSKTVKVDEKVSKIALTSTFSTQSPSTTENVPSTTTQPSPIVRIRSRPLPAIVPAKTFSPNCQQDVLLVFDMSATESHKRERFLECGSEIVKSLQLGNELSRVAAVRFSGRRTVESIFHLRKHTSSEAAAKELLTTRRSGPSARMGEALLAAFNEFDPKNGGRTAARKIMIVFTDGHSLDDPLDASDRLAMEHVRVFVVAVADADNPANADTLEAISTGLDDIYVDYEMEHLIPRLVPPHCKA